MFMVYVAANHQLPTRSPLLKSAPKNAAAARDMRREIKLETSRKIGPRRTGRGMEPESMHEHCSNKVRRRILERFRGAGGKHRRIATNVDQCWSKSGRCRHRRPDPASSMFTTGARNSLQNTPRVLFEHFSGFVPRPVRRGAIVRAFFGV